MQYTRQTANKTRRRASIAYESRTPYMVDLRSSNLYSVAIVISALLQYGVRSNNARHGLQGKAIRLRHLGKTTRGHLGCLNRQLCSVRYGVRSMVFPYSVQSTSAKSAWLISHDLLVAFCDDTGWLGWHTENPEMETEIEIYQFDGLDAFLTRENARPIPAWRSAAVLSTSVRTLRSTCAQVRSDK